MITKEKFIEFLDTYQIFENGIDRMTKAISGKSYGVDLFESDWGVAVSKMLDMYLESYFTEEGVDLIYYYLFEPIESKAITVKQDKDMFNEEKEIEYVLNNLEDVWNFLLTYKEIYFNKDA